MQKVREAAARLQCTNNLKQIGLAMHNYHDAYAVFPPSAINKPNAQGWGQYLLPYFEQNNLYKLFHWEVNWYDPINQPVVSTNLKVMLCPSAPSGRMDSGTTGGITWTSAPTDYTPTTRIAQGAINAGYVPQPADVNGAMVTNQFHRITEIQDGTSNTIALAEDAGRPQMWEAGRLVNAQATNTSAGWADRNNLIAPTGSLPDGSKRLGPCPMNCTNNNELYSFHTGGVNVVLADGSVHFLRQTMSLANLAALITRSGGEVLTGNEF